MIPLHTRLATACVGALLLACADGASAQAQARYMIDTPFWPSAGHHTASVLRVEGRDAAGGLVGQRTCSTLSTCNLFPSAVKNFAVLDLDAEREEVVREKCNGVESTVPQLRCEGFLEVWLRLKVGLGALTYVTDGPPLASTTAAGPVRMYFAGRTDKYWDYTSQFPYDRVALAYRMPVGRYDVAHPALGRNCLPVPAIPSVRYEVTATGGTVGQLPYRATDCLVEVAVDRPPAEFTLASQHGPMACEAKGQSGVSTTKSICTGRFRYDQPLTLSATMPAGFEPSFSGSCDIQRRTTCSFKPALDYRTEIFTNIKLTSRAASTPPAPDPATLVFAPGASSPADAVVAKGTAGVPMLQARATASNGTATLQSLTLKSEGSGRDDLDLAMVKVVVDANGNGTFDAGETVLAQGRPAANDGTFTLAFGSTLAIPASATLLVVADIAGDVHEASAARLGGAAGLVLAIGVVAWPAGRRRLPALAVALVVGAVALAGCGGGSDAEDPPVAEAPETPVDPPPSPPPPAAPLTYRLDIVAFAATDAATPPNSLATPLRIEGATVTVQR